MKKFILCCSLFLSGSLSWSQEVDPSIHWKVVRIGKFDVVYDAKHQDLADFMAPRLERIQNNLSKYFAEAPETTTLVLNDDTDLTNGYSTAFPYNLVMIYPVLPENTDSIGDYGDWAYELPLHEYTHTLTFVPKRGLVKTFENIFGSIIVPNMVLPRWWLEGIAVEMETHESSFGRLRSKQQDASVRALLINNNLLSTQIADINEVEIPTWPYGSRPYIFGSLVWSDLLEFHSEMLQKLLDRYGGRVPFFIERPVDESLNMTYQEILNQTLENLLPKLNSQIKKIETSPVTQGENVLATKKEIIEASLPTISPDGLKMAFLAREDSLRKSIKILSRKDKNAPFEASSLDSYNEKNEDSNQLYFKQSDQDAPTGGSIQRVSWFPDSTQILYDKISIYKRFYSYSDLYTYELKTKKLKPLTHGVRAREGVVSPDGKTVAFVKIGEFKTELALLDMETKNWRVIYHSRNNERVANPIFVDNNEILFADRVNGKERIVRWSIAKNSGGQILPEYPGIRFLNYENNRLLFISDKSGVGNLYESLDLKTAKPLTNSLTTVYQGALDGSTHDLYFSELTDQGLKLKRTPQSEYSKVSAQNLPQVESLVGDRFKPQDYNFSSEKVGEGKDYNSFSYLLPRYWLPGLSLSNSGNYYSLSTSANDPLNKQSYTLSAYYDDFYSTFGYLFGYVNTNYQIPFSVRANQYSTEVDSGNLTDITKNQYYDAFAFYDYDFGDTKAVFAAGLSYLQSNDSLYGSLQESGPFVSITANNAVGTGAQISPESGYNASFSAYFYQLAGSTNDFNQYDAYLEKYFSKFGSWKLPDHNAIFTSIRGQYINELVSTLNLQTSENNPYIFQSLLTNYPVMRGYAVGKFLAKNFLNYTFEYRFPVKNLYRGFETLPFYMKRLYGAVVAEGIQYKGQTYLNPGYESENFFHFYSDVGLELKFDTTVGYHFPITFYTGVYDGLDSRLNDSVYYLLGFIL